MIKRTIKYTVYSILGLLLGLVILGYALFNSNAFQNWLCGKTTQYLSAQFNTNISIGHIGYNPFSSFTLENVYFGDQKKDTLFYVGKLTFNLGEVNIDSMFFELRNVKVEEGLCKITTYKDGVFNINVLLDYVHKLESTPGGPPFHMLFRDVECTDTRFMLTDFTKERTDTGFDPFYEHMGNIRIVANNFHIIDDSLILDITSLSGIERSGFTLSDLKCNAIISSTGMWFSKLDLKTPYSHIGNYYSMEYRDWNTMSAYNDSVLMIGKLRNASIDMRDIAYFAPALEGMHQKFIASTDFKGTVADFTAKNISLSYGTSSLLEGRVSISGFPDIDNAFIDAHLLEARTTTSDISYLINQELPEMLNKLGVMKFKGDYTGFFKDYVAYGEFDTKLGKVRSDLNMKLADDINKSSYSGSIELIGFDMGTLIGQESYLGKTSLQMLVKGEGFNIQTLNSEFNTKISALHANHYDYENITVIGKLNKKMFNGDLIVKDTNLMLSFGGIIDFNNEIPLYRFKSKIERAFLNPLHIDTSNTIVSADIDMDFAYNSLDENKGQIAIKNILCIKNGRDYRIDHVVLQSDFSGNKRHIKFNSDQIDCTLDGEINITTLLPSLKNVYTGLFPGYFVKSDLQNSQQNFDYELHIRNTRTLSALFVFNYSLEGLVLKGKFNTAKSILTMDLGIDHLLYNGYDLGSINSELSTVKHKADFNLSIDHINQKDTLVLRNLNITANATLNNLVTGVFINDTANHIFADCISKAVFKPSGIEVVFDSSSFEFRKYPFNIGQSSKLVINNTQIDFNQVLIKNNAQQILFTGFYDLKGQHNVRADMVNIDLSIINAVYRRSNIRFGGISNGALQLKGNQGINFLDAYLNITALKLDNDIIGDFSITSNYNEKQKRFMVYAKSVSGKLKNLEFGGYLETSSKPYNINMNVSFDESPLNSFQAFLKDQLYIFEGTGSAKCKITGNLKDYSLSGKVYLNDVKTRVEYLKTVYTFGTVLSLDKTSIQLKPTKLMDVNGNSALLTGSVKHNSFNNIVFDIHLNNLKKFMVLNTTFNDNSLYYGTGLVSGDMKITGPVLDIVMDARIRTEAGTQFNIPLGNSSDGENQLMKFINTDTLTKVDNIIQLTKLYGFSMNLFVEVTPAAEIQIIMDAVNDDKIRGTGRGTLKMELTRQGQFNMYGGVTIQEGDYNFTAMKKVLNKKFILKKGGTILWAGNPLQASMDISGVYKVRKTSVADIIPYVDEASYNDSKSRRIPVECLLYLKGNLLSPDIKFDLNFPEMSINLGADNVALENTLATLRSNPDMMNQQVVSLMVFGKFVPMNDKANTGGNINAGVSNTISDLVSKQVNKGVEQLVPGLDFNVDVQYGAQQKPQYIVSASQKLFDNRLEVQASYDINTYNNNFLTQYNIRKDGSLKFRAFSKRNTGIDQTYNKNITIQGVGLYYTKEFDRFSELFRSKQDTKATNIN